ncbi:hypothetical protein [Pseudorhodoferax sp. Leaf274]|uniref:hypothetical protein n=1 Tax=Pseudorhodoferax sp. Leaf274 TaxID=1736318 RepID=UPI000703C22D|nr:hypothetical protein [Pseudorhodoferax sp. Leaf274]KQP36100.1 hypothetical protein ASF44_16150 [Pseudorhodoferax sp. Leaf274]
MPGKIGHRAKAHRVALKLRTPMGSIELTGDGEDGAEMAMRYAFFFVPREKRQTVLNELQNRIDADLIVPPSGGAHG